MTMVLIYAVTGLLLFSLGMSGVFFCAHFLRKILAVNLAGSGVFLVMIAFARRGPEVAPDAIPHALVLTGIVVAASATALALVLYRRLATSADEPVSTEGSGG